MSKRNRATVGYLLRQLNELRQQINEAIEWVDPKAPGPSFTCRGCGHSDWEHTNFTGGCIATKPCGCVGMDTIEPAATEIRASATSDGLPVNECDHITDGLVPAETEVRYVRYTYCPKCGVKL